MRKDECERAIRYLCHKWRAEQGLADTPPEQLNFEQFFAWIQQNHASYLGFRTTASVRYDSEMWFDAEFGQSWRR